MALSAHQQYRFYEILAGLPIWLTLFLAIGLSFIKPLWMIYFIIVFDIYWVLRVVYFAFYLVLSWRRFRKSIKTDWFELLKKEYPHEWQKKKNAIFLPLYNEDWEVVSTTLNSLIRSTYPAERIVLVMSGEERALENWQNIQQKIKENYAGKFADILLYTHPEGLPGEIPGKGSNIHYAEKQFKKYADRKGWNYKDIIASIFDIDTVAHKQYFANLTYMYCRHPRPERSSFQPLTLYNNNIWSSPSFLRVMSFGTTFWILFSLARLDNLVTFSSHSMSFKAIVDCGGHARDIVSEDSRIFYQCWLRYGGDYEVTPLYVPVSMDTVWEKNLWRSLKNLYYQQRRWAWGAEHIPYLMWQFGLKKNKTIN